MEDLHRDSSNSQPALWCDGENPVRIERNKGKTALKTTKTVVFSDNGKALKSFLTVQGKWMPVGTRMECAITWQSQAEAAAWDVEVKTLTHHLGIRPNVCKDTHSRAAASGLTWNTAGLCWTGPLNLGTVSQKALAYSSPTFLLEFSDEKKKLLARMLLF